MENFAATVTLLDRRTPSLRALESPPPLHLFESEDDILMLAQVFLERCAARAGKSVSSISPSAAQVLGRYAWPGQVRELASCIEQAVSLSRSDELAVEDLPLWVRKASASRPLEAMADVEKRHIQRVLVAVQGNKALAARMLGFDRSTLYRKMDAYGLR